MRAAFLSAGLRHAVCLALLRSLAVDAAGLPHADCLPYEDAHCQDDEGLSMLQAYKKSKYVSPFPKVIYIIRHGEKVYDAANETAYSYACESEQGWGRAYNLVSVFGQRPKPNFKTPQALYSFNYDDGDLDCRTGRGFYRTQATISPLGYYTGVPIDNTTGSKPDLCGANERGPCHQPTANASVHDYGPCCNVAAAAAMKAKLAEPGVNAILAAWEHANIAFLANALGATDSFCNAEPSCNLSWSDDEFDKVFALYYDDAGNFRGINTNLYQEFFWLGPVQAHTAAYDLGPGEKPGIN